MRPADPTFCDYCSQWNCDFFFPVYSIPTFVLRTPFAYLSHSCDHLGIPEKNMTMINFLCHVYKSEKLICPFNITWECHRHIPFFDKNRVMSLDKKVWYHIDLRLTKNFKLPKCNVVCQKKAVLAELKLVCLFIYFAH